MKSFLILILCLIPMLGLNGCSFYWNPETKAIAWKPGKEPLASETEDTKNKYNLKRLEKGITLEEVYGVMGMPDLYTQFESVSEDITKILFYYDATDIDDGAATVKECIPLVIVNEKLAGWGRDYYAKMEKPDYLK